MASGYFSTFNISMALPPESMRGRYAPRDAKARTAFSGRHRPEVALGGGPLPARGVVGLVRVRRRALLGAGAVTVDQHHRAGDRDRLRRQVDEAPPDDQ